MRSFWKSHSMELGEAGSKSSLKTVLNGSTETSVWPRPDVGRGTYTVHREACGFCSFLFLLMRSYDCKMILKGVGRSAGSTCVTCDRCMLSLTGWFAYSAESCIIWVLWLSRSLFNSSLIRHHFVLAAIDWRISESMVRSWQCNWLLLLCGVLFYHNYTCSVEKKALRSQNSPIGNYHNYCVWIKVENVWPNKYCQSNVWQ